MSKPHPQQLNLPLEFEHQRSIIGQLYQLTLQTAYTTKELERSWEALARYNVAANRPRGNQKLFYGRFSAQNIQLPRRTNGTSVFYPCP